MNWEAVGAIAEALGAVGVIATLAYLAVQIRQNSRLLRASTASASVEIDTRPSVMMVQDPEVTRIYWAGIGNRESLSETDLQRFDALVFMTMKGLSQQFHFSRDGLTTPEAASGLERDLSWLVSCPGIRDWWADWRANFDDHFCEFMDHLISRADPSLWPRSPSASQTS